MYTQPITSVNDGTRRQARRGLALYVAIVVALSVPIQAVIISADLDGGANGPVQWIVLIAGLMVVPAIASVVARLALKEGFSDVSFRLGGRRGRHILWQALLVPVVIGLVVYGSAWTAGLVEFEPPPVGGWVSVGAVLLILNIILVSGEEIGWRGYMLTRLIDAGVPRPMLASGLIWGLWHVPLVVWAGFGDGPSPLLSVMLLLVTTTAFSYMLARMRLETGSVWPAILLHVTWNTAIQAGFDVAMAGAQEALWVGENGLLTALVLVVAAAIYSRGRWTIIRTPPQPEKARMLQGDAHA